MNDTDNEFTRSKPRKRRVSSGENSKAEEALPVWRGSTAAAIIVLGILSCKFFYGVFMGSREHLCVVGPMLVLGGALYWMNQRANYLQQLIMDYQYQCAGEQ